MEGPDFAISTKRGSVPHIIDTSPAYLDHPLVVYVDDIFHLQSYYFQGGDLPINEYLNTNRKIFLRFKHNSTLLRTFRGNYKISEGQYDSLVKRTSPYSHAIYQSPSKLGIGEIYDPIDIEDMICSLKRGCKLVSCNIVNELTENGVRIHYEDNQVCLSSEVRDCVCCAMYGKKYIEYLLSTGEMSAMSIISLHNYYQLDAFFRDIRKDGTLLDRIVVNRFFS
jgi:hypothetical protein